MRVINLKGDAYTAGIQSSCSWTILPHLLCLHACKSIECNPHMSDICSCTCMLQKQFGCDIISSSSTVHGVPRLVKSAPSIMLCNASWGRRQNLQSQT